jgi:hypothetical protein
MCASTEQGIGLEYETDSEEEESPPNSLPMMPSALLDDSSFLQMPLSVGGDGDGVSTLGGRSTARSATLPTYAIDEHAHAHRRIVVVVT